MKELIEKLRTELDSLKYHAANYRKWIRECKINKNEYGVISYSESLKELSELMPQYKQAIRILKSKPNGKERSQKIPVQKQANS